jgi:hypothetical protein
MLKNRIKTSIKKFRFGDYIPKYPKHNDAYLVSYPKSGNTWVSFLIANVIKEYLHLPLKINFNTVRDIIPDIHMTRNVSDPNYIRPFNRIIKSHCSYNPLYNTIFLIIRKPSDLIVSYYYYLKNRGYIDKNLNEFVFDNRYGLKKWKNHTLSWLDNCKTSQRLFLIRYEKLKSQPQKILKDIFRVMGFEITRKVINKSIKNSSLENMKKIEEKSSGYSFYKHQEFKFVRKGKTNEGRELISKEVY